MIKLIGSFHPSIDLSPYIASYNLYQVDKSTKCSFMVPEGVIELVFQLDSNVYQSEWNSENWIKRETAFIGGLHRKSYYLRSTEAGKLVSVRFKPGAFSYFITFPANSIRNQMISIDSMWKKQECDTLIQQIYDKTSVKMKIDVLEEFLKKQFKEHHYGRLCYAAHDIINSTSKNFIESLSEKYNLSMSRFRELFGQVVGCSPKQFQQTRRINEIIYAYNRNRTLTELAYQQGYYDQSHFINEFKQVTGCKPSEFKKKQLLHEPVRL